jgi:hypothetical protein
MDSSNFDNILGWKVPKGTIKVLGITTCKQYSLAAGATQGNIA